MGKIKAPSLDSFGRKHEKLTKVSVKCPKLPPHPLGWPGAHLVNVMQHGLSSGEHLPTDGTGTPAGPVLLLQVSVESLDEGCPHMTDVTSPGFVVLVVPVHVVHQPSKAPALFVANLAETELLVILR